MYLRVWRNGSRVWFRARWGKSPWGFKSLHPHHLGVPMSIPSVVVLNEAGQQIHVHVCGHDAPNRKITVDWPFLSSDETYGGTKEREIPYEAVINLNIEAACGLDMHDKPVWSAGYNPGEKMRAYREERAKTT